VWQHNFRSRQESTPTAQAKIILGGPLELDRDVFRPILSSFPHLQICAEPLVQFGSCSNFISPFLAAYEPLGALSAEPTLNQTCDFSRSPCAKKTRSFAIPLDTLSRENPEGLAWGWGVAERRETYGSFTAAGDEYPYARDRAEGTV